MAYIIFIHITHNFHTDQQVAVPCEWGRSILRNRSHQTLDYGFISQDLGVQRLDNLDCCMDLKGKNDIFSKESREQS